MPLGLWIGRGRERVVKERKRAGKGVEYIHTYILHTVGGLMGGGTDTLPWPVCGGDDKYSFVMCGVTGGKIKKR